MRVLITHKQIIRHMAGWAVAQHPYGWPEGLKDVLDKLTAAAQKWHEGVESLRMMWVHNSREIEQWLELVLADDPIIESWNTPRSGHESSHVFVTRYGGLAPEHDFIDIGALYRNVASSVWRDNEDDADDQVTAA